jgi:maleate cis-trans isomerase
MKTKSRPALALIVPDTNRVLEDEITRTQPEVFDVTVWRMPLDELSKPAEARMLQEALPETLEKISETAPDLIALETAAPGRIGGLRYDHELSDSAAALTGVEVLTETDALLIGLGVLGPTQVALFTAYSGTLASATAHLLNEIDVRLAWSAGMGFEGGGATDALDPDSITDFVCEAMIGLNPDCVVLGSTRWRGSDAASLVAERLSLPVLSAGSCTMDLLGAWVELAQM